MSDPRALIRDNPVSGVRNPPGSSKAMVLPDIIREWADQQPETWDKAIMVVFPTQYGAQNIKTSFIDFRGKDPERLRLVTGIDKQDKFYHSWTRFQIVTYGVLWQWLVNSGDAVVEHLLAQGCAFL